MTKLLLVDGTYFLYRAFHATPPLRNARGEPTGAIYGVLSMLRRLEKDFPASHRAVIFDAKGKTFRQDWYAEYKANRPAMPDDLIAQQEPLRQAVAYMGWDIICQEGIEADDVIGTLAKQAVEAGLECLIATGDKDMAQLVNERVLLINTMANEIINRAAVIDKYGIPPERMIDYLALVGDRSDNIPGVDKCGAKTAAKWLTSYGDLDTLIARSAEIPGVVGENLRKHLDFFPLAIQLVTIKLDAQLPFSIADLQYKAMNEQSMSNFCDDNNLKRLKVELGLSKTVQLDSSSASNFTEQNSLKFQQYNNEKNNLIAEEKSVLSDHHRQNYQTINNWQDFDRWLELINQAEIVALDTETTSLNPLQAKIIGISLAVNAGIAAYIPIGHGLLADKQLNQNEVLSKLKPWLENPQQKKVGQNIKFDQHIFANYQINLQGISDDTMLLSYVLESHRPHDLEKMSQHHLGLATLSYSDLCGKGAKQISFSEVAISDATLYASEDADLTLRLYHKFKQQLNSDNQRLQYVYQQIEMPTREVLFAMERHGFLVDAQKLNDYSAELANQLNSLEIQVYQLADEQFNLSSPKQLGEILFNKLQLPQKKKTRGGTMSTDEEVLADLALDYPIAACLSQHRQLAKLKNTYTDKLPKIINPRTGRVHTTFAQSTVATGRLASSEPNLQNIPVRNMAGRRIRSAFIAAPEHYILSADYSQIELRIMAHLSQDQGLLSAFANGEDIHRATATEIFACQLEEVTSEQRRIAKSINFGLIYGMSSFGLAKQLEISRNAAQTYIDRYFARYPGVLGYMQQTRQDVKKNNYVDTIFGRRLGFPGASLASGQQKQAIERAAINAPMQGSAADLVKLAMVAVHNFIHQENLRSRLILQVHDELIIEVWHEELNLLQQQLAGIMTEVVQLSVPLLVDVGYGLSWDEAH